MESVDTEVRLSSCGDESCGAQIIVRSRSISSVVAGTTYKLRIPRDPLIRMSDMFPPTCSPGFCWNKTRSSLPALRWIRHWKSIPQHRSCGTLTLTLLPDHGESSKWKSAITAHHKNLHGQNGFLSPIFRTLYRSHNHDMVTYGHGQLKQPRVL